VNEDFKNQKENMMLTVTAEAAERLKHAGQKAPDGVLPRVQQEGASLALTWDRPRPRDQEVTQAGAVVLVYDESLAQILFDKKLDVVETDQGTTLTIT
jgi:Fe-S cluster assembly iron-binding protein IscA